MGPGFANAVGAYDINRIMSLIVLAFAFGAALGFAGGVVCMWPAH